MEDDRSIILWKMTGTGSESMPGWAVWEGPPDTARVRPSRCSPTTSGGRGTWTLPGHIPTRAWPTPLQPLRFVSVGPRGRTGGPPPPAPSLSARRSAEVLRTVPKTDSHAGPETSRVHGAVGAPRTIPPHRTRTGRGGEGKGLRSPGEDGRCKGRTTPRRQEGLAQPREKGAAGRGWVGPGTDGVGGRRDYDTGPEPLLPFNCSSARTRKGRRCRSKGAGRDPPTGGVRVGRRTNRSGRSGPEAQNTFFRGTDPSRHRHSLVGPGQSTRQRPPVKVSPVVVEPV